MFRNYYILIYADPTYAYLRVQYLRQMYFAATQLIEIFYEL